MLGAGWWEMDEKQIEEMGKACKIISFIWHRICSTLVAGWWEMDEQQIEEMGKTCKIIIFIQKRICNMLVASGWEMHEQCVEEMGKNLQNYNFYLVEDMPYAGSMRVGNG